LLNKVGGFRTGNNWPFGLKNGLLILQHKQQSPSITVIMSGQTFCLGECCCMVLSDLVRILGSKDQPEC
jgi:hypothetical protein